MSGLDESDAIEALLAADWHADQCGCVGWPEACVGLVRPHAPTFWTVEAVLEAQARLARVTSPAWTEETP